MKWNLLSDHQPINQKQLEQILLSNRGITDKKGFFEPVHPLELELSSVGIEAEDVVPAVERILEARDKSQKIIIFGDYDADGICATTVMWQTLHALGCQVLPFIPDRKQHGYGLSQAALDELLSKESKPDLIITVDNGIVAFEPIQRAIFEGVHVIITDHHAPETDEGEEVFPLSTAIVHTTKLCGTTVAWILARELAKTVNQEKVTRVVEEALDVCGIATIADQVALTEANRSFAFHGVRALQKTKRPGICALLETGSAEQKNCDTFTINYVLAPRINAMGRLAHGMDALRLLCTNSLEKARELAVVVNQTNVDRQELTADLVNLAVEQAQGREDQRIIVVASDQFHEGVVGLVAGKLVETFGKPAIAISLGEAVGKASARSVPGVNIIELIRLVRTDLLEAGGHPMAAGFSLEVAKLEVVRQRLETVALEFVSTEDLNLVLDIDCPLPYELFTKDTVRLINQFAPFGKLNPEPTFVFSEVQVFDLKTMGRDDRHLRFKAMPVSDRSAEPISCVAWGFGERAAELEAATEPISLACTLTINQWNGRGYLQAVVVDITR